MINVCLFLFYHAILTSDAGRLEGIVM